MFTEREKRRIPWKLIIGGLALAMMVLHPVGFGRQGKLNKFHSPRNADQGFAVIAYYPVWGVCDMPPQDLDWRAFSHLIFFWGEPTTTYPYFSLAADACDSAIFENGAVCNATGWCLNPLDNGSNGLTHQAIIRDSAAANGVKLLLCVGGETGTPSSILAGIIADTSMQNAFIQAATAFAKRHGYDGIDIDWEFPTRGAVGRANYTRFLQKMRAALDTWSPRGELSMAVPTWYWWDPGKTDPLIDVSTLNSAVDFVDLMEYGMQNTSAISHYSPLYQNPSLSQETWDLRGIKEWEHAGVDSSRIVTLIPFEDIMMSDVSGSSPVQIGHASSGSQWIGLRDIPPTVTIHWDDIAKANWGEVGTSFYSFENQSSINAKVKYARDQHIRGIGIWELWRGWLPNAPPGQQQPLLEEVKSAVSANSTTSPNQPKIRGEIFFDNNNDGILDVGKNGVSSGPSAFPVRWPHPR